MRHPSGFLRGSLFVLLLLASHSSAPFVFAANLSGSILYTISSPSIFLLPMGSLGSQVWLILMTNLKLRVVSQIVT